MTRGKRSDIADGIHIVKMGMKMMWCYVLVSNKNTITSILKSSQGIINPQAIQTCF